MNPPPLPARMEFWQKMLSPRMVSVVDVGAMPAPEIYHLLLLLGMAEVVAFEPNAQAAEQLNTSFMQLRCFPWLIGNGGKKQFHINAMPHTSSIYPSNLELLAGFGYDKEFTTLQVIELESRRLDDIREIHDCDLLKMDVQGAEVDVIQGAIELLSEVTIVQPEICFVPFYHGQPLFGEVDQALRAQGFMLHRFVGDTAVRASWLVEQLPHNLNQLLWTDAVYIRDPARLEGLNPDKLLNMALILDLCYHSPDAAAKVLQSYDRLTGASLLPDFMQQINKIVNSEQ
ncbi:MAG TPA: FkbM family methyltransferase [Candidatus Obscuribacterales bacterium]